MEEIIVRAVELVTLAINDTANVLEQTTALLKTLDKEEGARVMENSELIKKKLEEMGIAEERLYKAQRDIK